MIVTRETAATDASASPRKPSVRMVSRSDFSAILLVAWRRNAVGTSSRAIPQPSSAMRIKVVPPFLISTVMCLAPASMEFSTSSLMTEAGRSMTSPAAISSDTDGSRTEMTDMGIPPYLVSGCLFGGVVFLQIIAELLVILQRLMGSAGLTPPVSPALRTIPREIRGTPRPSARRCSFGGAYRGSPIRAPHQS